MDKLLEELSSMQQIYGLIFSLSNKLQIIGDERLEKSNLTTKQFMMIVALLHIENEEVTVNNIAKKLGTSKQNTAILVKSLEKKGFLKSQTSLTDKRALNIELTELGKEETAVVSERFAYFLLDIFSKFELEELQILKKLISKLYYENIDNNELFELDESDKMLVEDQDEMSKRMYKDLAEYNRKIRKCDVDENSRGN